MTELNINSKIKLQSGTEIPVIGLGTWKIRDHQTAQDAVTAALAAGYRHIDTAKIYQNEEAVSRALAQTTLRREEIFVTTKLWNADQGYDSALAAIDASLSRLKLSYVDLYLIHWPYTNTFKWRNKRQSTWAAMEEIKRLGKARAIGVSNYTIQHLEGMKTYAKILPDVNQVEIHPYLPQHQLLKYCRDHNIQVEAYSPLAHGKKIDTPEITKIAAKYSKTNAQVLIRWSLQHGLVVLPKSTHKDRIEENINVFDFAIDPADMDYLDSLDQNYRTCWDPT